MIATIAALMMLGAGIAAEAAAFGFDRVVDADDADTIGAGALHLINGNGHLTYSSSTESGSSTWSIMLVSMVRMWQSGSS